MVLPMYHLLYWDVFLSLVLCSFMYSWNKSPKKIPSVLYFLLHWAGLYCCSDRGLLVSLEGAFLIDLFISLEFIEKPVSKHRNRFNESAKSPPIWFWNQGPWSAVIQISNVTAHIFALAIFFLSCGPCLKCNRWFLPVV